MKVDGSSGGVGGSADGRLAGVAAALALRTVDRRGQGSSGQLLPLVDDLSADASDRCRVVHVVVGTAGGSADPASRPVLVIPVQLLRTQGLATWSVLDLVLLSYGWTSVGLSVATSAERG